MASVKDMMNCIGANTSGSISVLFDFFGFFRGRVPADPDTSVTAQVSLLDLMNSLQGKHVHLNIIRVGIDTFTDDPSSDSDELDEIDYSIYKVRNVYRQVNLGVGRILHWDVTVAQADGKHDIGSDDEAEELTDDWSVDNDGIDVFMVKNISTSDFIGLSPVEGPCDKDDKDMNGVLGGEVSRTAEGIARTFAHEIGHYLGLEHNHDDDECPDTTAGRDNLMAQTGCANSIRDSVVLSSSQGSTMRSHCFVKDGC